MNFRCISPILCIFSFFIHTSLCFDISLEDDFNRLTSQYPDNNFDAFLCGHYETELQELNSLIASDPYAIDDDGNFLPFLAMPDLPDEIVHTPHSTSSSSQHFYDEDSHLKSSHVNMHESDLSSETLLTIFLANADKLLQLKRKASSYKCPITTCPAKAKKDQNHIELHLQTHKDIPKVSCLFCFKKLYTQDSLVSHQCKCSDCLEIYTMQHDTINYMINHTRTNHPLLAAKLGITQDASYTSSYLARLNESGALSLPSVRHDQKIICPVCENSPKSLTDLNDHMRRRHPTEPNIKCKKCYKKIYAREHFINHRCLQQPIPTFTLSYLEKDPSIQESLKLPNVIKTVKNNILSYLCSYCNDYEASHPSELEKHIEAFHSRARNTSCSDCKRIVYTQDGLRSHRCLAKRFRALEEEVNGLKRQRPLAIQHGHGELGQIIGITHDSQTENEMPTPEEELLTPVEKLPHIKAYKREDGSIQCPYCWYYTTNNPQRTIGYINKHITKYHPKVEPVECVECHEKTFFLEDYESHACSKAALRSRK